MRPQFGKERSAPGRAPSRIPGDPTSDFSSVRALRAAVVSLEASGLSPTDCFVARLVMDHVDSEGLAYPSMRLLAKRSHYTLRTVFTSIHRLTSAGSDPKSTFWFEVMESGESWNVYRVVYRPIREVIEGEQGGSGGGSSTHKNSGLRADDPADLGTHEPTPPPPLPPIAPSVELNVRALDDGVIRRTVMAEYTKARKAEHKLSEYWGKEPDWDILIHWARALAIEEQKPGERALDALGRVLECAFLAWMKIDGNQGKLRAQKHRLDWLRQDLDTLTAHVRAVRRRRAELAENVVLRPPPMDRVIPRSSMRGFAVQSAVFHALVGKLAEDPSAAPVAKERAA